MEVHMINRTLHGCTEIGRCRSTKHGIEKTNLCDKGSRIKESCPCKVLEICKKYAWESNDIIVIFHS